MSEELKEWAYMWGAKVLSHGLALHYNALWLIDRCHCVNVGEVTK